MWQRTRGTDGLAHLLVRTSGDSWSTGRATEVYLYQSNDLAIASESITEVLNRLDRLDRSVILSSFSISQLLRISLVPLPHTEWEEVWFSAKLAKRDRMA